MRDVSKDNPAPRFTVAITGTRDVGPDRVAPLRRLLSAVLDECSDHFGCPTADGHDDTRQCAEKWFVSGMAEGADQIGMAAAKSRPDWRRKAILPFERDEFLHTFKDPQNGAIALNELLDMTTVTEVLAEPHYPKELDWRERRYVALGNALIDDADLLIAIWRGTPALGPGGTAQVVAMACDMGVPIVWLHPDTLEVNSIVERHHDRAATPRCNAAITAALKRTRW